LEYNTAGLFTIYNDYDAIFFLKKTLHSKLVKKNMMFTKKLKNFLNNLIVSGNLFID